MKPSLSYSYSLLVIHPVCPLNMSCGALVAETMDSISLNSCCFPKETNLSEHTAHVRSEQASPLCICCQSLSALSTWWKPWTAKIFLHFSMLFLSNKNPCLYCYDTKQLIYALKSTKWIPFTFAEYTFLILLMYLFIYYFRAFAFHTVQLSQFVDWLIDWLIDKAKDFLFLLLLWIIVLLT